VEPPNPLIDKFQAFPFNPVNLLPPDGFAVYAGPSNPDFAKKVAKGVKAKFGFGMPPDQLPHAPGAHALYGILMRDLTFEKRFFRSFRQPLDFKDGSGTVHKVAFFGTAGKTSGSYGDAVKVLSYNRKEHSFILSIATNKPAERIIIYRSDHALSFDLAIEHVNAAIKAPLAGALGAANDPTLHRRDTVKIPYLKIYTETDFSDQLKGLLYYGGESVPWTITKARQITKFDLFEKGAKIRVVDEAEVVPFGPAPRRGKTIYAPRAFICDVPFFVAAWRDGVPVPYFAAWIDGLGVLAPFGE